MHAPKTKRAPVERLDPELVKFLKVLAISPGLQVVSELTGHVKKKLRDQISNLRLHYGAESNHEVVHQAWLYGDLTLTEGYEERLKTRPRFQERTIVAIHIMAITSTSSEAAMYLKTSSDSVADRVNAAIKNFGWTKGNKTMVVNAMWDYGYFKLRNRHANSQSTGSRQA